MNSAVSRHKSNFVAYLLIVIAGLAAGLVVSWRMTGVFSCSAEPYGTTRYMSYCSGSHYGDYDHGAFWFGLEPAAQQHAKAADVVFLGNSRIQIAMSSQATDEWFKAAGSKYYLLGFTYEERMGFARRLLEKLQPQAKFYVVNLDTFFRDWLSEPAGSVVSDSEALSHYQGKRRWQSMQRWLCAKSARFCGNKEAWYRSVETGAMMIHGVESLGIATADDAAADIPEAQREVALAETFLATLGVPRKCVLFTVVPYPKTPLITGKALAEALNVNFVAPSLTGLVTLDGSHLDAASAERWSAEFLRAAGPYIKDCLGAPGSAQ